MKRIIIAFLVVSLFVILEAQNCDLKWNRPWLSSNHQTSFLKDQLDEELILHQEPYKLEDSTRESIFALSSVRAFKLALNNFFSRKDKSTLINYRTPQRFDYGPGYTNLPSAQVPMDTMLKISLFSGFDYFVRDNDSYSFMYYGTRMAAHINSRLFITGQCWAGHFSGDMAYAEGSSLIDSWYKFSDDDKALYLDNVSGSITYRGAGDFWSVSIGRNKYEIGSNIGGSVILNNDCNEYGYFSTKFIFPHVYISYLHAALIPDSARFDNKDFADKFIAVHKIGWTPYKNFELFAGELMVYANRSLDLNYLLPHSFWRVTEHNLSDRDNALIFTGLNYKPKPDLHLYFNFLLDELKKKEFFGDWWGNKYAFQLGASYTFDIKRSGIMSLEFTAIRPWLYTHYIQENRYSHNDISLGFPSGSNLIQYTAELCYDLLPSLNFNTRISYLRQGSVGNSFTINYNDRPSDEAEWLEGDIIDSAIISPTLTWQFLAHHKVRSGIKHEYNRNDDTTCTELYLSYQALY
ncbi:hypothetical protein ACFLYK_04845 [Candidatus Cloacimonadota bacterium]